MSTAQLDDPAQTQGGVWDYISPSRLNLWMKCPLAFKLRYIDGIRMPTTAALFIGKQTHRSLEIFYRHRMLGVALDAGEVASKLIDGWDAAVVEEAMVFANEAEEMKLKQQTVDLVAAYLKQLPDDEPTPIAVEATMEAPLIDPTNGEELGIPLLGVVDLILPDVDGPLITDFKTSSRSSPPFEVSHEIQLTSYAYLHRQLTGVDEGGLEIRSLIKTKKPKVEQHHYEARQEHHFRRLFAVIREYLDAIDRGHFTYRPGWGCGICDHREDHCRQWAG